MEQPTLYRKRLIPQECILLKDDIILQSSPSLIITKWNTLKARSDLSHGYSAYFIEEGFKVSMMFRADQSFLYWYIDIVDYEHDVSANSLTSVDLLIDVIIYPHGFVKVVDLDELSEALTKGILSSEDAARALSVTDRLLRLIYSGEFKSYQDVFTEIGVCHV